MTVCPCCGFKFEGDLQRDGCKSCGARAVGPPLSRPAHELPFYGRALSAAETAAWRLKWIALPVILLTLWASSLICASIRRNPKRFAGSRIAHTGLTAAALVTVMIATFIGITIPERLRQRQLGLEAATSARLYTMHRAFLEYRALYGGY